METANIERDEMYRTFNCGVGMIIVVSQENANKAMEILNQAGETAFQLGQIEAGEASEQVKIV